MWHRDRLQRRANVAFKRPAESQKSRNPSSVLHSLRSSDAPPVIVDDDTSFARLCRCVSWMVHHADSATSRRLRASRRGRPDVLFIDLTFPTGAASTAARDVHDPRDGSITARRLETAVKPCGGRRRLPHQALDVARVNMVLANVSRPAAQGGDWRLRASCAGWAFSGLSAHSGLQKATT